MSDNPLYGVTHDLSVVQDGFHVAILFRFNVAADADAFYAWLVRQSLVGKVVPVDFSRAKPK